MTRETIHSDRETIDRYDQQYRISTKVKYDVRKDEYQCKATLFKSYNGKIHDSVRDMLFKQKGTTSEKDDVPTVLEECVEECRERMKRTEDAKDVSISFEITDQ